MPDPPRLSWTQPSCLECWIARNPGRLATRVKDAERESCVYCGEGTEDGIYVRIDPAEAPHPTLTK
jgi:hypothetical protein